MAGDDTTPTEPLDTLDSGDPSATPDRPGVARRAVTAVVAVLALVAAGAFGAVLASGSDPLDGLGPAASSTSPESEPEPSSPQDREVFRHRHGPKPGHGLGLGLGGAPLHGELVVPDQDGDGYRTVVVQRGEVTSASTSQVSVTSEDGFAETYTLTDETRYLGGVEGASSLQEGDQVHVTGVREGGTVRALHVADLSRLRERFERFGDLRDRLRDRLHDRLHDRLPGEASSRT